MVVGGIGRSWHGAELVGCIRVQDIAGWKEFLAPKLETCLGKNGLKVDVQSIDVGGQVCIEERGAPCWRRS